MWTEELAQARARRMADLAGPQVRYVKPAESSSSIAGAAKLLRAKGRIKQPKGMNKTETAYSNHLEVQKRFGEILWWKYEGLTLKLGDDCRFTLDFAVMLPDGSIELHDTKVPWSGKIRPHIQEDALVKLRTAAEMYPFTIRVVWPGTNGEWESREY